MKIRRTAGSLLAFALLAAHVPVDAAGTLASWLPPQSGAPVSDNDPVPGATVIPNVAPGALSQTNPQGFANTLVWPVSVSAPRSATRYLEFAVTPSGGRVLAITGIQYSSNSFFDSDVGLFLRSSRDAFASDLDSARSIGTGSRSTVLRFNPAQTSPMVIDSAITFRLFPDRAGATNDFLDLRGNDGVGLRLLGEFAQRRGFGDAQFYSFANDLVGGFQIPGSDRNIRFLSIDASTMRLQNQFSGDARVLCLPGQKNFFATTVLDAASVTETIPTCLRLSASDLPSDVSIWKLPDGRLFRFQMLQFSIITLPPDLLFEVSGTFQAGPIQPLRIFVDGFEP